MKLHLLASLFFVLTVNAYSQPPQGYYTSANGKSGTDLQQALHDIIGNHTFVTYNDLWTYFKVTDKKPNSKVWDMYSDIPGGIPPYEFKFDTNQCSGSYNSENDCYNREHSWPKSWFGGEVYPMYSDLYHLYPTDGYVNNKRDNYPYGEVNTATWTSLNGSKLGSSKTPGYSGVVFEPINEYKGDFARSYFYMATRYYKEDTGWPGSEMVVGAQLKPWAVGVLLKWANMDVVSQKEINRNNAIFAIQHNRNPFIDNPDYAIKIWGTNTGVENKPVTNVIHAYPNPVEAKCTITLPTEYVQQNSVFVVYSSIGIPVNIPVSIGNNSADLNFGNVPSGLYLIRLAIPNTPSYYEARIIKK